MKTSTTQPIRRIIGHVLLVAWLAASAQAAPPEYATPYYFTTLAGAPSVGSADGNGAVARFNGPYALALDPAGNLYVGDNWNGTIRKITPAGMVSTLAGTAGVYGSSDGIGSAAQFSATWGVVADNLGNVYVADVGNHTIRKITAGGVVTTFAGLTGSSGSADGIGSDARFFYPCSVTVDSAGFVYVVDSGNKTIRKITPAGVVSTLAGLAGSNSWNPLDGPMPSLDGTGNAARFISPFGIAVDAAGNLYVADEHAIRKITPAGVVSTFAGMSGPANWGSVDGTGSDARFTGPGGVAVDAAGNVYIADAWNNTIRKITPAAVVTTLAGMAAGYPPADGSRGATDGPGNVARFAYPKGVAVDAVGNIYVADSNNNTIRKITPAGVVSTLAGVSPFQSAGSADGMVAAARFEAPHGATVDTAGNVYVADTGNHTIRKITTDGVVTTFAGTVGGAGAADGTGGAARLYYPQGIAADAAGNLYVADTGNHTVRKIAAGTVTTFAGLAGNSGSVDGTGSTARFSGPEGVAVDPAGNVYVADPGNHTIRKITPAGITTTIAGVAGNSGAADGPGSAARLNFPQGVATDLAGNVYVADTGNFTIRRIAADGIVTTLAGLAGSQGSIDGLGGAARFDGPEGIAVDVAGNVYVTDNINYSIREVTAAGFAVANTGNYTIRKITPAGVVSTLAGLARGSTDGLGSKARFDMPYGIAADAAGHLYVSCSSADSNTIRKGELAGPPVISVQPLSQTAVAGGSVQFSVTAGGIPTPSYQWYFNGSAFSGATSSTLNFANLRSSDAGEYTVIVSNELGSVTSNKAALTVSAAPAPVPEPGGGGGSMGGWIILALLALGTARLAIIRSLQGGK